MRLLTASVPDRLAAEPPDSQSPCAAAGGPYKTLTPRSDPTGLSVRANRETPWPLCHPVDVNGVAIGECIDELSVPHGQVPILEEHLDGGTNGDA